MKNRDFAFVSRSRVAVASFLICVGAGAIATFWIQRPWPALVAGLISLYPLFVSKIEDLRGRTR
jgi:hypothetical protein